MVKKGIQKGSGPYRFMEKFGKPIEEYASVIKATEGLKPKTIRTYHKMLPFYFLYLEQDPDSVIEQRKIDIGSLDDAERYEKKTIAFAKQLEKGGLSGNAIASQISRIQGFFANNGRRIALDLHKLKLSKARKRRKYSPSNEEVRAIVAAADSKRDRLIVTLMYQNGPAPMDVSLLKCGDYPGKPWVYFEKGRSKTGEVWRGISVPDVCDCLNDYLKFRGDFDADDFLIVGRDGPMTSDAISTLVHEIMVKALGSIVGLKPTSLRDAFEDALVEAETYHKIKEALMAHNSGIEAEYGGHNRLVEKLVEAMRKVYPLICLNDSNKNVSSTDRFSPEQWKLLEEIMGDLETFRIIRDGIKAGKIVNLE